MSFEDQYLPSQVQGLPCQSVPRFSTKMVVVKSGAEYRNQNWQSPLRKFILPQAVTDATLEGVLNFWLCMGGPFQTWPFRDPHDFASCPLDESNTIPLYSGLDQPLGIADGLTSEFQLIKNRVLGSLTYTRTIYLPVTADIANPVIVLGNGLPLASAPGGPYTFSVSRPGGIVTISPTPEDGLVLTSGFLYDTEVRWEADDTFEAVMHAYTADGTGPINLVEVRHC